MKKILCTTALLLTSSIYAAGFTTPPPEKPWMELGLQLGMLKLSDSHLNFGILGNASATYPSGSNLIIKPDYDGVVGLSLRFPIPHQSNDVEIAFNIINQSNHNDVVANGGQTIFNTELPSQFANTGESTSAEAKLKVHYTDVYADIGHAIDVNDSFDIRLFAGARYADLKHNFWVCYEGIAFNDGSAELERESKFSGIGPMVGLDSRYALMQHVSLIGRVDGTVYIGDISSNQYASGVTNSQTINLHNPNEHRAIPSGTVKLGLEYEWNQPGKYSILVQGGYSAQQFLDIVANNAFVQNTTSSSIRESHDISFHGPFALIKVVI